MIIGLTGTFSSGKDTVAKYLVARGFRHISTSDVIRRELKRKSLVATRENLQKWGNKLREKYGAGYLAEKAVGQRGKENIVVSGLRNMGEVVALKKNAGGNFLLLATDGPKRLRFERAKKRGRASDNLTFEEFNKREKVESSRDPKGLQTAMVMAAADVVIWNNGTKRELAKKVDTILPKA